MIEERTRRLAGVALGVLALGAGGAAFAQADGDAGAAQAGTLTITATGTAKKPTYAVPATVPAGLTKITLRNKAKGELDSQLIRTDGAHTAAEVVAELKKAFDGKAIADWLHFAGGAPIAKANATSTATTVLKPGAYFVFGGDGPPTNPPTFTVTGDPQGTVPATKGVVTAREVTTKRYGFGARGLKPGRQQITLRVAGKQSHHFLAAKVRKGTTAAEVGRFLKTEKGRPPFAPGPGIESTVIERDTPTVISATLSRGRYAFFCFISDRKGGPPHAISRKMVTTIDVK